MTAPNLDNLPVELTGLRQACVRYDKQPYIKNPKTGNLTASWAGAEGEWAGPEGYLTFSEARRLLDAGAKVRVNIGSEWVDRPITGIGFMNARAEDPARQIVGGDLDCCRNPITGNIGRWAYTLLHRIQPFYVEVSPSQTGVRFFARGHLPDDVDSVTGYGDQDDLPAADREAILKAKPKAREKLAKGKPAFNGVELYVDSRHLTITGDKLPTYCYAPEDRTNALAEALRDYLAEEQPIKKNKSTKKAGSFPPLNILQVIDTTGFEEHGGELVGSHPTEGSITGANLKVNPGKGVWSYLHDFKGGTAPGGDAWMWLACECGVVPWMSAGAGMMADPVVIAKTMQHAADRGLIPETEDIIAAFRRSKVEKEQDETEAERIHRLHAEANIPITRARADMIEAKTGVHIFNADDDPKPNEITEEDLKTLPKTFNPRLEVRLEAGNFITKYMTYAKTTSDAYEEYHFASGLVLASVAADRQIVISMRHGDIYPNIWIFPIGDSTVSRKTTAHKLCKMILRTKYPKRSLPFSFSPEALMDAISATPKCYYLKDEAGSLLSSLCKDYMAETRDFLAEIYECDDYYRKLKKSECQITDPYITQYLMTTPDNLKEYTTPLDLTSGWLLRYLWMYPNYPKEWKSFAEKDDSDFGAYTTIRSYAVEL